MGTLQDLYAEAYANYANDSRSAIERTRSRGRLEQLRAVTSQEMQGENKLTDRKLANTGQLDTQRLSNEGQLATQESRNRGAKEQQESANKGAREKQQLANRGKLDDRRLTNTGNLEKQQLVNTGNLNVRRLANLGSFKNQQLANTGRLDERNLINTAPQYEKVQTGVNELAEPIYEYKNVNTYQGRLQGQNAGAINQDQLDLLRGLNKKKKEDFKFEMMPSHSQETSQNNLNNISQPIGNRVINSRLGYATGLKGLATIGQGINDYSKRLYNTGIKPAAKYLAEEVR